MLDKIKSSYFYQKLFSFVDEGEKLKIIKCNKNLQKILGVGLLHYKLFSGKYIIYEENNKRKIFNSVNDELIFEGEYLNGKRNGKAKEYDENNGIIFKGEYLNNMKNGKGKEYDKNNSLILEGEYLNGKKWNGKGYNGEDEDLVYELKEGKGYVKEYIRNLLVYEGEYLNGEKNGKGKEYNKYWGRLIYDGEYLNGKRNGKAKEYYVNHLIFEGEYLNGLKVNI